MKKAKVNTSTDDKTSENDTAAAGQGDDSQDGSTHACDHEGTSQDGVTGIENHDAIHTCNCVVGKIAVFHLPC